MEKKKIDTTVVEKVADKKTEAEKIWEAIKDRKIEMFALPDQFVHMYVKPVPIDPSKLFVKLTATAVLPSLEVSVAPEFTVQLSDKYVIITRK